MLLQLLKCTENIYELIHQLLTRTSWGQGWLCIHSWTMAPISTTCAVHTEDCEGWWLSKGWWLSNSYSSVVQYWLRKPGALGSNPGFSASSILHQTCQYVSLCIYQKAGASTRKKIKKIRKRLNPRVNPFFAPNALASFNLSSYLHRQNIIVTIVTNEALSWRLLYEVKNFTCKIDTLFTFVFRLRHHDCVCSACVKFWRQVLRPLALDFDDWLIYSVLLSCLVYGN